MTHEYTTLASGQTISCYFMGFELRVCSADTDANLRDYAHDWMDWVCQEEGVERLTPALKDECITVE